ncbi:hypothetical protein EUGRSUZ_G00429 [Eucalyptus grandis]|uniref:Uncharacterized protein n=2 Tax=Eucalyptus grandis TaxID=71139 RepID=A0ACC3K121_EUCGR|nr:hypothetical protein EUGRSUZ_G00429 [Eucalyptus grandis]
METEEISQLAEHLRPRCRILQEAGRSRRRGAEETKVRGELESLRHGPLSPRLSKHVDIVVLHQDVLDLVEPREPRVWRRRRRDRRGVSADDVAGLREVAEEAVEVDVRQHVVLHMQLQIHH